MGSENKGLGGGMRRYVVGKGGRERSAGYCVPAGK